MSPAPLSVLSLRRPRYQRVAEELRAAIRRGSYPIGTRLPPETVLCAQLKVSRFTLREALRELGNAGLISRRRRTGTIVTAGAQEARTNNIGSHRRNDNSSTAQNRLVYILSRRQIACNSSLSAMLECMPGRKWLRTESLTIREDDGRRLCATILFQDRSAFGSLSEAPCDQASPGLELPSPSPFSLVEQQIIAVKLGRREARRLQSRPGLPALLAIRRYYISAGVLVALSRTTYRGSTFSFQLSLLRDSGWDRSGCGLMSALATVAHRKH